MSSPLNSVLPPRSGPPQIVAVGFKRINKMLQELAPGLASKASVDVLDMGFEQAVARIREMQARRAIDVVVAAGSNGAYLRQHLDMPVVLVKVGGFDLMQALARAKRLSSHVGLVTYQGMAPDLAPFGEVFELGVVQRSYETEDDARACLRELQHLGVEVVVGTGLVADLADELGLTGVFLYSMDAVRDALEDAVEVARASRIELAKRERLNTILAQLSDGVIAVDQQERIQTLNPAMAQWLGVTPGQWLGRVLSDVCPDLSLQGTLRLATQELEKIERVRGKALIVSRMPIIEQGVLTGAVLSCQDPISIQRVDRHIRTRIKPQALAQRYELGQFLGTGAAVERVRQMALSCARSTATVLLIGESGTGKELIAQGIHRASERRDMPFVAVNCAAVSETLLESELFGYEEGAFTGARRGGKIGLFEAAHNGTLFLDEVGEMPVSLQARLLRVLQEREVLRVGATEPTPVNVRVIAATHRDLRAHVERGEFRLDLFYRLNILRIDVPPLRERVDDIGAIARAVHARLCTRLSVPASRSMPLIDALVRQAPHYDWPGNVREMENIIERVMAYGDVLDAQEARDPVRAEDLLRTMAPELFGSGAGAPQTLLPEGETRWRERQQQSERAEIQRVLDQCGGDRRLASERLGISRTTLWRKLRVD
ncbi:MAG TPA: propionate catabolism operon regulatory protein PrpR [Aquabacterium sp.]|uniref:propionate catabolism operon regulatory protein PrpR n=1 Tax=Aquabacterium sp. TaxID=1872578 RepID=UPI002E32583D|nr:propionate catabolism operon regulatory protein PrpR [Aquabacterium sp.]HEX5372125.1 propionate catabolism operon regulatory protein PrpR [Aquabacterium sp.]